MGWRLACLIAVAALIGTWSAAAQQSTPEPQASVVVGAYEFTYDPKEPIQVYPIARATNGSGAFVTWHAAAQLADGSVVGLTACDDVAVICVPLISPAKAAFQTADVGDSFNLARETVEGTQP